MHKFHILDIDKSNAAGFVFFDAVAKWAQENGQEDRLAEFPIGEDGIQEIEFRVNGIELNFMEAMKGIEEQFNRCVEAKAKEIINYKMSILSDMVNEKFAEVIGE